MVDTSFPKISVDRKTNKYRRCAIFDRKVWGCRCRSVRNRRFGHVRLRRPSIAESVRTFSRRTNGTRHRCVSVSEPKLPSRPELPRRTVASCAHVRVVPTRPGTCLRAHVFIVTPSHRDPTRNCSRCRAARSVFFFFILLGFRDLLLLFFF